MSKLKTPSEKKRVSLVKDRRNVYGESPTKDRIVALSRSSFNKVPDAPLGEVVVRKLQRRARSAKGRKSR
jgi:hypothetical protein